MLAGCLQPLATEPAPPIAILALEEPALEFLDLTPAPACRNEAALGADPVTLWRARPEGGAVVRIPALVRTPTGALLAFGEMRHHGPEDYGHVDIVMRRSVDRGANWGPAQTITSNGLDMAGNPLVAVDRESGLVTLLTTWSPASQSGRQLRDGLGEGTRTVWAQWSEDDGLTWSAPLEITADVKDPTWSHYGTGPGHALQLKAGPNTGRLVATAWHSDPARAGSSSAYGMHLLLSDDGGWTWRIGAVAPGDGHINPNEAALATINGRVLIVARDEAGYSEGNRAQAWSSDGGETFDAPFEQVLELQGPIVHASLAVCEDDDGTFMVHAAPRDPSVRRDICLASYNDGEWKPSRVVHIGPGAYTDIIDLGDGTIGILYEAGIDWKHEGVRFQVVPWREALSEAPCK